MRRLASRVRAFGDAEVFDEACDFMVNRGQARAADVMALIGKVRSAIRRQVGVRLNFELKIVGKRSGMSEPGPTERTLTHARIWV